MSLDIHTLAIVLSLINLLQVHALFVQYRMDKNHSGLGWWTLGNAISAIAFVFNYLRGNSSFGLISTAVNGSLALIGLILIYVGVLRFLGKREQRGLLAAFWTVISLACIYFTFVDYDLAIRRLLLSVAVASMSFLIARALFLHSIPSIKSSACFLGGIFLVNGAYFCLRALSVGVPGAPIQDAFAPTLTQTSMYLVLITVSTLWTFGFIIMVNQRLNAESRETKENLELIFNARPDAVVITRFHDGGFVDINECFTELTGYTRADAIGKFPEVNIWKNLDERQKMTESLKERGACENLEAVFQRKDGSELSGMISAKRINLQGEPHIIAVIRDITERKRAEAQRLKFEEQIQNAQRMESVGRLAGGVAHDFNNMLHAILGNVDLALEEVPLGSQARESLQEIQKSAQRSADLTQQLLAFARRQTVLPKIQDLNQTVEGFLDPLRQFVGQEIDLLWLPAADSVTIKMDPTQVQQILSNLCVNARAAIVGKGKITIGTRSERVDLALCADHPACLPGEFVVLTVTDNGAGMDKETLSHIFEPFFTTKRAGEGVGLGLPTTYGIVKQNNGFIHVASEQGKGTTFEVYLPSTRV